MKSRFCPKCKSTKVVMPRGDGVWWRCVKCRFEAGVFPEKEIKIKKMKRK